MSARSGSSHHSGGRSACWTRLRTMSQMPKTTTRCRTAARHGLWIASLFVVLGGLFGMHGLADHGTGDMSMMSPAASGAVAHPGDVPGLTPENAQLAVNAVDVLATKVTTRGVEQADRVAPSGAGSGHQMLGLCAAVLTAGLLTLLAMLVHRPARGFFVVGVDVRRLRSPAGGRDPDPPSLTRLSIRRC